MANTRENITLDFEIEPLPEDLLARLPTMKRGQRIVAIRKARGIHQQIELRKRAKLASATCATIETRDVVPSPEHLYNISNVLKIDPLLIVIGRPWKNIPDELTDTEKMFFLRLRRGLTQKDLALELEKAGLVFETNRIDSKRTTIAQWERGAAIPTLEKRSIIRKVLGDETLFQRIPTVKPKPIPQKTMPVVLAEPKPPTIKTQPISSQPLIGIVPDRQTKIDVVVNEALAGIKRLGTTQFNSRSDIESHIIVRLVHTLAAKLRQLDAKDEAEIIELDLANRIAEIKQTVVRTPTPQIELKPKISAGDRKIANRTIGELLRQFPGKSILQILPILVRHGDWTTVRVAVDRIEEHQTHKLTPEDFIYLKEVKEQLKAS